MKGSTREGVQVSLQSVMLSLLLEIVHVVLRTELCILICCLLTYTM